MPNIAVVILAGGLSSRMGRPKHLLELSHKSFIMHLRDTLIKIKIEPVYLSGVVANGFDSILDDAVYQQAYGKTPVLGLLSAINYFLQTKFTHLLVMSCDTPLLTTTIFKDLIDNISNDIDVICYQEALFPLCISVNKNVRKNLLQILQAAQPEQRSVREFIHNINHHALPLSEEQKKYFVNVNTEGDYRALVNCRVD